MDPSPPSVRVATRTTLALEKGIQSEIEANTLDPTDLELTAALRSADVVVTPTTPSAAFRLGEKLDDPLAMYLSDIFTTPASLVGLPAVAVPSGFDGQGLPLSLQVMGRPFEEATVFRAARAFETLAIDSPLILD